MHKASQAYPEHMLANGLLAYDVGQSQLL